MNFKTATDALFERITHDALASELGVSVPSIRQARLSVKSKSYREPPKNWEQAIKALAERKIRHYHELIGQIEKTGSSGTK